MTASASAEDTDLHPEEHARAVTYSWLAALLRNPPDAVLLDSLRSLENDESAPAEGLPGAWALLRLAADDSDPEQVAEEFQQLFVGLGRGELVPFASWYLTGYLMERPLGRLRGDLRSLGFERLEDVREPEDHVGALLEVMSMVICDPDIDFGIQQKFFADHLDSWVDRFFEDLETARTAKFYQAVGRLGSEFVKLERDGLQKFV